MVHQWPGSLLDPPLIPAEFIKLQGDWHSGAYLAYLEMTRYLKQAAVTAMVQSLGFI